MALFRMKPHYRKSGGGTLSKYGTFSGGSYGLRTPIYQLSASSVGDYALFAGGYYGDYSKYVTAYNKNLIRTFPFDLSEARTPSATCTNNWCLFGGGAGLNTNSAAVDAYSTSLGRANVYLTHGKHSVAAATAGEYALFAGGWYNGSTESLVDAFNSSLTRIAATSLGFGLYLIGTATINNHALFAGGQDGGGSFYKIVLAYDASLTRTQLSDLSEPARCGLTGTSVGNYALLSGGWYKSGSWQTAGSALVDAFDSSLTHITTVSPLYAPTRDCVATTVKDYALFSGGTYKNNGTTYYNAVVTAYDKSLVRTVSESNTSFNNLYNGRTSLAATSVGNYALFGGGYSNTSSALDLVDVYQVT